MDRVSLAAGAPKAALAEMVCPSRRVTAPEHVAVAVTALLAKPSLYASGSWLWIGPENLELISVPQVPATAAMSAAATR